MASIVSQSSRPSASLNFFEPVAFKRSPTKRGLGSWSSVTAWKRLATDGSARSTRAFGGRVPTSFASAAMCFGVVPQQPPTRPAPKLFTNSATFEANSGGARGKTVLPALSSGMPALGRHETWRELTSQSERRCSAMGSGPVPQLSPTAQTSSNGSTEA